MGTRSGGTRAEVDALIEPSIAHTEEVGISAARDAGVDATMLGEYLGTVIELVRSGQRLSPDDLDRCRQQGEQAAEQGVALSAILDLYLTATWRLWAEVNTRAARSSAATVAAAAATMFRAADDAAEALAAGYERSQRRTIRFEESLRREFVDDLLAGSGEPDVMVERAARFGFNLAGAHQVAVARTGRRLVDAGPVHSRVEAHVLTSFGGRDVMVATREGSLVCLFPGTARDPASGLVRSLEEASAGPWRVGIGRPGRGTGGLVRSYAEARQAIELADRLDLAGPVARFEDLLPYRVLTADTGASRELVERVLGPLHNARGGGQHLIDTLEAHIAASGNLSATARALHLSPRAVGYRFERITELTGHSPSDPEGRFVLELAVRCRALIGA
ncbi:MAG: helix-turn-helix domain-containing protein [Actinomycetota bacterium]